MMASWMLYCLAVAVLAGLGAVALERALAALGRPVRWAWLAAMAASVLIPAAAMLSVAGTEPQRERVPAPSAAEAAPAPGAAGGAAALPAKVLTGRTGVRLTVMDTPLLVLWGGASALVLVWLASAAAVLALRRRRWHARVVDGTPVLVAPDTGPAVVGLVRSAIVLPGWVVEDADPAVRALMIAHEEEHLRAGDPRLLLAAISLAALMPWNPALWWQLRRLRLAVEVDCDARVLRRSADVRAYGHLLLEVGRRASGSALAVAAFSEPASFLERRIRIMTRSRVRASKLVPVLSGGIAALLVFAACETPHPTLLTPTAGEAVYIAEEAAPAPKLDDAAIRALVEEHFPDVLRSGVQGAGNLYLLIDGQGRVLEASRMPGLAARGVATPRKEPGAEPARPEGEGTRIRIRGERGGTYAVESDGVARARTAAPSGTMLERVDPNAINTIDIRMFKAGEMGPDELGVMLVRLKSGFVGMRTRSPEPEGERTLAGVAEMEGAATPSGGIVKLRISEQPRRPDPALAGVVAAAIGERFPELRQGGVPAGETLWFVVDARGRVLRNGRMSQSGWGPEVDPDRVDSVEILKASGVPIPGNRGDVIWITMKY